MDDRRDRVRRLAEMARGLSEADRLPALRAACGSDGDLLEFVLAAVADDPPADRDPADAATLDPASGASDPATPGSSGAHAVPGEAAGQWIGPYRLQQRLGEGGFGTVWMAEQREPVARRVALKIIKLGMDTREVIARFEAERQALALMDHPNIARVLDAGATETGRPFFVMELVRGLPITEYCDRHRLDIRQRMQLIVDACEALQHAHQKGVIHRDIKPSNVLVGQSGDRPVVKVIDFGIAKATTSPLTRQTLFTRFHQMIGTPQYMSPEQAGDATDDVDTRSDVYSTGVLLYELITGTTPIEADSLRSAAMGELQRMIRDVEPPRPSTRVSQLALTRKQVAERRRIEPRRLGLFVRGEIDWIVMKAIEKDRTRRYESASAMARDIRRFLDGDAIEAAPPSPVYAVRKFLRRHRAPVAGVALVALFMTTGLVASSYGFFDADRQRREAETQRDLARQERERADERAQAARAAEDRATLEKERADATADAARAAEAVANRNAYTANMLLASRSVEDRDIASAAYFLDRAPAELRGWEWGVLSAALDDTVGSVTTGAAGEDGRSFEGNRLIPHPDGTSFLVVRPYRGIAVERWTMDGTLVARFEHPAGANRTDDTFARFALSPDGSRLHGVATHVFTPPVDPENPVYVASWDADTGERTASARVLPARPIADSHQPAISPDGTRVLLSRGETVWIQDVATGELVAEAETDFTVRVRWFSPDGTRVFLENHAGHLEMRDGRTLGNPVELEGHQNFVFDLTVSACDRFVGTASLDGSSRVFDLEASPPTSIELLHGALQVQRVHVSPDASLVLTSGTDGMVRLWRRDGTELGTITGDGLLAGSPTFAAAGDRIAAAFDDGTLRFWDLESDAPAFMKGHRGLIIDVAVADGPGLVVSGGFDGWAGVAGCVRLWDLRSGEMLAALGRPGEIGRAVAASPDGRVLAFSLERVAIEAELDRLARDCTVLVDLETGRVRRLERSSLDLAFDPTGELLALGRRERLEIRRADDGSIVRFLGDELRGRRVDDLVWSPDGRFLACSITLFEDSNQREHVVLDAETLAPVHRPGNGPLTFSHDGRTLLVGSRGTTLDVVRTGSWEDVESIEAYPLSGMNIAFRPDGTRMAAGIPESDEVLLWDGRTFDPVGRLDGRGFVAALAWSGDGTRLVAGCGATVRVWDARSARERLQERTAQRAARAAVRGGDGAGDPTHLEARSAELIHRQQRIVDELLAWDALD